MASTANDRLGGKVAIITGGGQGSGRGAAVNFAREGAAVVLFGRTLAKLQAVADEIATTGGRAIAVAGDVTDPVSIAACVATTIETFGRIDILVNAAQSPDLRFGPLLDMTDRTMAELWSSGPMATLGFMKACHPHLKAGGVGAIVNFGTGAQNDPRNYGVYAAAKAAIQTISRAAAMEWADDGIRVNVIVPLAASPAYEAAIAHNPAFDAEFTAHIPLGRMGDPVRDIGSAILFLVSDDAAFITGTTLMVDGGHTYLR